MGYRTKQEPAPEQTFLERICHALDYTPQEIAKQIGVPYKELAPLLDRLNTVADLNKDDVWWLISALITKRTAMHLAVQAELNIALQRQRERQAVRIAAAKKRPPVTLPVRRPPLRR